MNRGYEKGVYKKRELSQIAGIVYHSTGPGPNRRHEVNPVRHPSPFEAAKYIYEKLTKAGPHYLIDQEGRVEQMCPLEYAAWHTGSRKSWNYRSKWSRWAKNPKYDWWFQRFPTLISPNELMSGNLWRGKSANNNTIGIEIIPPEKVNAPFSNQCLDTLIEFSKKLSCRFGFPYDKYHVISHCEAHPLARTGKFGPYDVYEKNAVVERLFSPSSLNL